MIWAERLAAMMADQGLSGNRLTAGLAGLGHPDRENLGRAEGRDSLRPPHQTEGEDQAEEPNQKTEKEEASRSLNRSEHDKEIIKPVKGDGEEKTREEPISFSLDSCLSPIVAKNC